MKITRRIQKFFGGNWGKPDKKEKDINLPNPIFPEEPIIRSKKKRKNKKPYISPYNHCPFCNTELPLDEKRIAEEKEKLKNRPLLSIWEEMYRIETCPSCKSFKVPICPACKRETWFNPVTRIYKHQSFLNCGFEGVKKE